MLSFRLSCAPRLHQVSHGLSGDCLLVVKEQFSVRQPPTSFLPTETVPVFRHCLVVVVVQAVSRCTLRVFRFEQDSACLFWALAHHDLGVGHMATRRYSVDYTLRPK